MAQHFDLFVIGGGSGGVACARRAAGHGAKVGLAEAGRLGGTCVNRGCIPKKLMHYGAVFGEEFRCAPAYGWRFDHDGVRLDWHALVDARNTEVARLNGVYERMLRDAGAVLFHSRARVVGRGEVEVDGERHRADNILVAVGGKPFLPSVPGHEYAITSDDALEGMFDRPGCIAVVGGGYIGVEQASIYNAAGLRTILVVRKDLPLTGFDRDVRESLVNQLRCRALDVRTGTDVEAIERSGDGAGVVLKTSTGDIEADAVLLATGRRPMPNTRGIGLEEVGVEMERDGTIPVDERYETNVPGFYAIGDCTDHAGSGMDPGSFDLTPVAISEGRALAECLFNNRSARVYYDSVPTAVFGLPQAAAIGLTEERAREKGFDVKVFRSKFKPLKHTVTGSDELVMMKLVVDRESDRVLGCHMVGEDAAEIIQGFAVAITAGATKAQFDATVALHPTAAEEFVLMSQPVN